MRGHNIWFQSEIKKLYPMIIIKYSPYLELWYNKVTIIFFHILLSEMTSYPSVSVNSLFTLLTLPVNMTKQDSIEKLPFMPNNITQTSQTSDNFVQHKLDLHTAADCHLFA